jgi:hypothetical protein
MASFNNTILTYKGEALLAKVSAGMTLMVFSQLKTSDYEYPSSEDFQALTTLADVKQSSPVSNVLKVTSTSVRVRTSFNNAGLASGYYLRAIAVFAIDPDEGEILYSITTSLIPDWIAPITGINSSTMLIDIITSVSSSTNVSIDVDPNGLATIDDIDILRTEQTSASSSLQASKADVVYVDSITSALASESSFLQTTKADKSYVDSVTSALASGSPKGTYATLSALQTAFPTGNSNIYVVTADGKWYYWNGSAWTAGGVYQATSIADGSVTINKLDSVLQSLFINDGEVWQ